MIRIGIDGYPLIRKLKAGIGYYTDHLLRNLLEIDHENEYFLYGHHGQNMVMPYANAHWVPVTGFPLFNKYSTLWMLFSARNQLKQTGIDVFWGTEGILPSRLSRDFKTVLTIHDLTYYYYPETMAFENYWVHKLFVRESIVAAHKIIADSDTTKADISRIFKNDNLNDKITTITNGVNSQFKPLDKKIARKEIAGKLQIQTPYILFVGTMEPRKNIPGLLKAFKHFKTKYSLPHRLVLAGAQGWKTSSLDQILKQHKLTNDEVMFLGYVEEADLVNLYCGADVFVAPSFYEGFGVPLLEAMACGTPVVASDIPVFREIVQDAGILVSLNDECNFAEALYKIITDRKFTESLITKGFERYKHFSWQKSAEKLLTIFYELAKV